MSENKEEQMTASSTDVSNDEDGGTEGSKDRPSTDDAPTNNTGNTKPSEKRPDEDTSFELPAFLTSQSDAADKEEVEKLNSICLMINNQVSISAEVIPFPLFLPFFC